MDFVFRPFRPEDLAAPAAGELYLPPRRPGDTGRPRLALFVLEAGPDGFVRGEGPVERIVIDWYSPTLDDMLAATFLERCLAGAPLPAGARPFAAYAGVALEGVRPDSGIPLESSLLGIYLALRHLNDLTDPCAEANFRTGWDAIGRWVLQAAERGLDPLSTPPGDAGEFARERAFLVDDRRKYYEDVRRGDQWVAHIPGGPPRAAALLLRQPRSLLFPYWCRTDPEAWGGKGYAFLAVHQGEGEWRCSTDPALRLSIQPLADAVRAAEARSPREAGQNQVWFNGRPLGRRPILAPKTGSRLSDADVLRIIKVWTGAKGGGAVRLRQALRVAATAAALLFVSLATVTLWSGRWGPHDDTGVPPRAGPPETHPPTGEDRAVRVSADGEPVRPDFVHMATAAESDLVFAVQCDVLLPPSRTTEVAFETDRRVSQAIRVRFRLTRGPGRRVALRRVRVNDTGHDLLPDAGAGPGVETPGLPGFLRPGENRITADLANEGAEAVRVTLLLEVTPDLAYRPDLYLLSVGISAYRDRALNLRYARADAEDVVRAFRLLRGNRYGDVIVSPDLGAGALTDGQATQANVLRELAWLTDHADPHGLAVVTLSGHMRTDRGGRLSIPLYEYGQGADPGEGALPVREMGALLAHARCPVIVFLDGCQPAAGPGLPPEELRPDQLREAVWSEMQALADSRDGVAVFAACGDPGGQGRYWQHGALTLALLECLRGRRLFGGKRGPPLPVPPADMPLTLDDLGAYAQDRVAGLVGGGRPVVVDATRGMRLDQFPIAPAPEQLQAPARIMPRARE